MADEIVSVVYKTTEYEKFKKLKNNRRVSAERLKTIMDSISEKEIMNPIIVTTKLEIIEGQGRFDAKRKLRLPIYYIIDENAKEEDCIRLNKNNSPWNSYDYLYSYADSGIESYIVLSKLYEELHMPLSRILRFANRGEKYKGGYENIIKSGKLVFNEHDCSVVRTVKEKCDDILSALQYTRRPNEAFCTGVKVLADTDGYEHSRMIKRCAKYRSSYSQMSNLEDQLKEFSRIYNKDVGVNKKLYFEDYMRNKGKNVREYDPEMGFALYDVTDNVSTLKED